MKKWKKFELSALEAAKKLNHGKTVQPNQFVKGTISGGRRQIDIMVDEFDFVDIECKDLKKHVDVKAVEEFVGKLADEGAASGIMISNSPFTAAAIKTAEHYGIELKHLVDAGHGDTSNFLFCAPVVVYGSYVSGMQFGFEHQVLGQGFAFRKDFWNTQAFDETGAPTTVYGLFRDLWNQSEILPRKPRSYKYELPKVHVRDAEGTDIVVDNLFYVFTVEESILLGSMGIVEGRGIYDVKNRTLRSSENMTFEPISVESINEWPVISAEKAAELKANFGMEMTAALPEKCPADE